MSEFTCYKCNEELTKEEWQTWEPFGLCNFCKVQNAIAEAEKESRQLELKMYWQLQPYWQSRLRDKYHK